MNIDKTKGVCIISILVCLIFKVFFFDFQYTDYTFYLNPWVEYMKDHGYFYALKDVFHNYPPLYIYALLIIAKLGVYPLYAIKIISIVFEYTAAFYIGKTANIKYKNNNIIWICMAVIPFIPTVFINSALMSQCDSIYATFTIASIYYLFKNKNLPAMIMLGISFSLKAQTAFVLPFFFVYLMRGHLKWYYFFIPCAVYLITIIPALIAGCPPLYLFTVYAQQAAYYDNLVFFLPNVFILVEKIMSYFPGNHEDYYSLIKLSGGVFMMLLTIVSGILLKNKKYVFSFELWIKLLFLSVMISPFFLPGMHERYLYLCDLVAVLYILIIRKKIYLPVGILFISFYSYIRCLYAFALKSGDPGLISSFSFFEFIPWEIAALMYAAIIIFTATDFVNSIKQQESNR